MSDPSAAAVTFLQRYTLTKYLYAIPLAALVYDHLLTVENELDFVWTGRFLWVKVLFCANRYWPLASLITQNIILTLSHPPPSFCLAWYNGLVYVDMCLHIPFLVILFLRVRAMYNWTNRWSLYVAGFVSVAELVSQTVIIRKFLAVSISIPTGYFSVGCFPYNNGSVPYAWAYWVPQLVSESSLFLLTLPKTFSVLRGGHTPHFTYVLLVDSFVYFGGVVAIILLNFLIWLLPSTSQLLTTFVGLNFAARSIFGCRLLMNMKKAAGADAPAAEYQTGVTMSFAVDTVLPDEADDGEGAPWHVRSDRMPRWSVIEEESVGRELDVVRLRRLSASESEEDEAAPGRTSSSV